MALPRVTYSNIRADFTAVHAALDAALAEAPATLLGRDHPNRIAGEDSTEGAPCAAASPIDRDIALGRFIEPTPEAIDQAVAAARAAAPGWAATPWPERVAAIRRFADLLAERVVTHGVACLIEVGKSRMEAMGEAEEAVDLARYYADEMERHDGYRRAMARAFPQEETGLVLRPHGVFAVIAPFNFPLALSVNMITGALLAGNTVVYKPSPLAGLTGALVVKALEDAGLPRGVVNLVCGGAATGERLATHPGIDGIAFTGSYATGTRLLRQVAAGPFMRPLVLEMGGKNPTYVTASADLDTAAEGVARSAFGLSGQKCSAGSRVFVDQRVSAAFLDHLLARTAALVTGDPRERATFVGPVISDAKADHFTRCVEQARHTGRVLAGGTRPAGGLFDKGSWVAPTIVADLLPESPLHTEELFLPFLTVETFADLATAITRGNASGYGLTAGCYARDEAELALFLDRAEAGVLYANRASGATTGAWPGIQTFCGWRKSGASGKGGLGPFYLPQFMREQSRTIWRG
jgi:1-pyrroline-5-carboxylate dehydrogenase